MVLFHGNELSQGSLYSDTIPLNGIVKKGLLWFNRLRRAIAVIIWTQFDETSATGWRRKDEATNEET